MADYFLGHSPAELKRLALQGKVLRPITERMLRQAGLQLGMRVLDIGCGSGDVSLIVAELVGSEGSVLGIDHAAAAVAFASDRAQREQVRHVSFREGTEADLDGEMFDFVVGRYVLHHQIDPANFVRAAAAHLRPGGIIAFHEPDATGNFGTRPPLPGIDADLADIMVSLRTVCQSPDVAARIGGVFAQAGLAAPDGFCERVIGMEKSDLILQWVAASHAAVRSAIDPTGKPVDVEQFASQLAAAVRSVHGQVLTLDQWCVWTTV